MSTSPSDAVPGAEARPEAITHFEAMPWGCSESDIRDKMGDPLARESVVNAVELAYLRTVDGQQVEAEFTVHQARGLIVGCFVVPVRSADDCSALFTQWRDTISTRYPGIEPREEREVEQDGVDFDEAFARGEASWCIEWDDPSGLARIELLVWPSAEVFWVSYYGPYADDWEEERFEAEKLARPGGAK
jgi:hypothetical protein